MSRRRKNIVKRSKVIDCPKTLRVVDKLFLCPVVDGDGSPLNTTNHDHVESRKTLIKTGASIYFVDDVDRWLRMKVEELKAAGHQTIDSSLLKTFGNLFPPGADWEYAATNVLEGHASQADISALSFWFESNHVFSDGDTGNIAAMVTRWPATKFTSEVQNLRVDPVKLGCENWSALVVDTFYTRPEISLVYMFGVTPIILLDEDTQCVVGVTALNDRTREDDPNRWTVAMNTMTLAAASLSFLAAHNIKTRTITELRTRKERKFIEHSRKKLPVFEQKVIDLWPERKSKVITPSDSESEGAKKRWHTVAGHFFTRNGKKYWRRGHSRGDKRLGVVQKRTRIRLEDT